MGKRRPSKSEVHNSDSDADQSYPSSGPKTRRKITSSRQPSKKRTKRDLDAENDVSITTLPNSSSSHAKSAHTIRGTDVAGIRTALLRWYSTVYASRNMPWRKQYDSKLDTEERAQRAYEVWISEIMLQQTQVATVIPYYNRWMEKFPTIRDLADASIDEVNSLWKGLGYYSRASRLLSGAQKAVKEYGGRLPDNATDMQANIPGIGRYSAGAICSIAYGENVPVLDGNVNRLLSRFLALHAPPKAKTTLDILWNAASAMVQDLGSSTGSTSTQYPGDINQALIELGSTVCKVRDPSCEGCPLRPWCSAYAATETKGPAMIVTDIEDLCMICEPLPDGSNVTAYPMRVAKKKAREELDIVSVVEWRCNSDRQFLLVRRPGGGLLAGLDEFPTSPNVTASMSTARQQKLSHEIISNFLHHDVYLQDVAGKPSGPSAASTSLPLRISKVQPAGDVVHVFSHIKKTYRVQWVVLEGTPDPPQLAATNDLRTEPNGPKTAGKGKGKSRNADDKSDAILCSQWVPLDAVATKNIGTGVVKVWNLCKALWEDE
ncbi:DNA glycosylase [Mycena maculata]|uniref:Adenine DNA glycosylase n=1 Tax=Mycena maculata TaxID=230809 RepID=A0AAD7J2D0_9AGAR|nr:DNA glycosylase [Mycena maculata]